MRVTVADLESDGLRDTATRVWCGVFKDINTNEVYKFYQGSHVDYIAAMIEFMDTCDGMIMHNGLSFDWPLLEELYGYTYNGMKVDTVIMSRLHEPNRPRPWGMKGNAGPHSVEAWGFRFGRQKPEHEDWSVYSDEMLHRCSEDVEIQHMIYNDLTQEAIDKGGTWGEAYRMSFKLFDILDKQETHGWLLDQDQVNKSISMLTKWVDKIKVVVSPRLPMTLEIVEKKKAGVLGWVKEPFLKSGKHNRNVIKYWGEDNVHVVCGPHSRVMFRPMDVDKRVEMIEYMLSIGWIPLEWNTNSEGETTSPKLSYKDPFEGVKGRIGKVIGRREQCKHRRSSLEGWLKRVRPDGRVEARVTAFCVTGRAKHSGVVNVPNVDSFFGKWMRRCLICPEGKLLIGCDAAGCQDRMLANRAGVQEFTDMLLDGDKAKGTDSHSLAMKAVNAVLSRHNLPPIVRGKGKGFNFAWKFGAADEKLGTMVSARESVGTEIRTELEAVFPAQAALLVRLTDIWRSNAQKQTSKWGSVRYRNGWIPGLDGRPVYIESEHAILVYMLQTDEAIMMAKAYVILYERLIEMGYEWGKQWAYVCWMHDEYTIECDTELAPIIAPMAEQAIADAGKHFNLNHCPQEGEAAIGRNWYEIH